MPTMTRYQTSPKMKGVYYILGKKRGTGKKPEKIYYIAYRRGGRRIEERVGREKLDNMTPLKAAKIREDRIYGARSNRETREAEDGRMTFSRLWERYVEHRRGGEADLTEECYWRLHLEKEFGAKVPSELVPLDIDRLVRRMGKTHSPGTNRKVTQLLTRLANYGAKKRLCPGLSFKPSLPEVNNERVDRLSEDQLKALIAVLDTAADQGLANIVRWTLVTGMRRGETLSLKWEDIEGDFIVLKDRKAGKDIRIPLNEAARGLLGTIPKRSDLVFPSRDGGRRKTVNRGIRKFYRQAGIPDDFRPLHSLRHHFASHLVSSGVSLYIVQRLLGQESIVMATRYSHLDDKALREGSEKATSLVVQPAAAAAVVPIKKEG